MRPALLEALRAERFAVSVMTPEEALAGLEVSRLDASAPDAIVVDAPSSRRLEICKLLRPRTAARLLLVGEASAADAADCLEHGADDFVSHPERAREVAARVRACLRRSAPRRPAPEVVYSMGPVTIDLDRHEVRVNDRPVHLPIKQFRLLELLLSHPGQVLTTRVIVRELWGGTDDVGVNTLQAQVARLRAALGDESVGSRIQSVPGLGYTFRR